MNKHRDAVKQLFFWIGLTCSAVLFLLPAICDTAARIGQTEVISTYRELQEKYTETEIKQELQRADAYNRMLAEKQKEEPFFYQGESATDERYESLLAAADGVMGYVEVEEADILLPICHGTDEAVLTSSAGHIYGTSLPVGGRSTHAVIAAHTGYSGAALFDNLISMKEGDRFTVCVPGKRLVYRVGRILTVLPEEADQWLQIQEGQDVVTLYTCTPYGVNDHRLLVSGYRSAEEEKEQREKSEGVVLAAETGAIVRKLLLLLFIPAALLTEGFLRSRRRRKCPDELSCGEERD
ncbi:MAG: class C sortase [Lachnospiraceae bacterium]|nr:class C sortase [Lachnospiraceae bacterium]